MTRRPVQISWAFADFAREPFFTVVMSLVFPPFFVNTLAGDPARGTAWWGYSLATTSFALVLLAPFAGALADASGSRRRWVSVCLLAAAAALASLWFATGQPGHILGVLLSIAVAQLSVELSRIYTDSLLPVVAAPPDRGRLSGLAVGLGFCASITYLGLGYALSSAASADAFVARLLSACSGAWLIVFMLPFLLVCSEPAVQVSPWSRAWRGSLSGLRTSLHRLAEQPALRNFLIARMVYWDGAMSLFAFLTIVAATHLHWSTAEMSAFGVAGLGAAAALSMVGGFIEFRLGPLPTLEGALLVLLGVTVGLALVVALNSSPGAADRVNYFSRPADREFLMLAVIGCGALGVLLGSSRSMLVTLARPDRLGETFGLYVMVGRASSFLAPLLVAAATTVTGDQRYAVFGVATLLLSSGYVLLRRVRNVAPTAEVMA